MIDELPPFMLRFNQAIEEIEPLKYITRSSKLQEKALDNISRLMMEVAGEKAKAVEREDESYANLLLAVECVLAGLSSEIQMVILLKEEDPDKAWDRLIEAQMSYKSALRAHPDGLQHLVNIIRRLEAIESLLFPPQSFMSPSFIARSYSCSICGQGYNDCCHVQGRPYWGEFCAINIEEGRLDHVAIVDDPADKRARIVSIQVEEGERNQMTWNVEPRAEGRSLNKEGLEAQMKIPMDGL